MLLTQKSLIEGARTLTYFAGMQMDRRRCITRTPRTREQAEDLLSLLTPIVKGVRHRHVGRDARAMRCRSTAGTATCARPASSSSSATRASR